MNHEIIKQVIFNQRSIIRNVQITNRSYTFEPKANYILVGLRRAGKSTLLYKRAQDLITKGADWSQIVYVNFEDERLAEFTLSDFDDIVQVASELTEQQPYYFLDEVQNIPGWERFARRLADSHEQVFITGSNASMLSIEMEQRLGGRFLSQEIMPFSFAEYLTAADIPFDKEALYTSRTNGKVRSAALAYMQEGGFPESIDYQDRRLYAQSVYQKVLLSDVAARYSIKNVHALRILMKKIAETVTNSVTFNKLRNAVNAAGATCSTDSVIDYIAYAKNAYLLFTANNYIAKFAEKESTPKYYFPDNGLLSLFLVQKDSLLLENTVAIDLKRRHGANPCYFKSAKTGIDIDFYIPQEKAAIQVCRSLHEGDIKRETLSLVKLTKDKNFGLERSLIVTLEDNEQTLEIDGITIEVLPLYKFLLRHVSAD